MIPHQTGILGAPSLDLPAAPAAGSTASATGSSDEPAKPKPAHPKKMKGHRRGFYDRMWQMHRFFRRALWRRKLRNHMREMRRFRKMGFGSPLGMAREQNERFRRHHKKRHCGKFFIFIILIPLLMVLGYRCGMKRIHRRVKAILEVENRLFREKYGCEWNVNRKLTELKLRRVFVASSQYPLAPNPFEPQAHLEIGSPITTEAAQVHIHHPHPVNPRQDYHARANLDESTVGLNSYR